MGLKKLLSCIALGQSNTFKGVSDFLAQMGYFEDGKMLWNILFLFKEDLSIKYLTEEAV